MSPRIDGPRHAIVALANTQHLVISRAQATEHGFSYRRIRTAKLQGWLAEPMPGVLRLTTGPVTWEQRLMTVVLASGGHAVASHRSAARLLGLDGFDDPRNAIVELSVARTCRVDPSVPAVVHHVTPMDPCDLTTVRGIPCTGFGRTLSDLGSVVREPRVLRRALTSARRRGIDLDVLRSDAKRLHRPGQAGTGALLRQLDTIPYEGVVPATWFEELLLMCVEAPGMPPIELQHRIVGLDGRIVARPDIAFPSVKLGLEAHSRRFHFGPDAEAHDEDRDLLCAEVGWELMYLGWYATKQPAEVLQRVRAVIRARQELFRASA
jgi:hypothetical protein